MKKLALLSLGVISMIVVSAYKVDGMSIVNKKESVSFTENTQQLDKIDWSNYDFATNTQSDKNGSKCGEGKCGKSMKKGDESHKCGEGKCGKSMKKGDKSHKCGEGKCGKSMKKGDKSHKCGEGKCGKSMKKDDKSHKCGEGKCGKS